MNELISVIVPIYNVEKYLHQCLKSIVNQTYKNLEIILVDDGSPDNCPKICDEYSRKDKRIKVIHKENGGLSSARNAGLDVVTGEYISFIDSDDMIDEKFIETLYNLCKENNCDISECNLQRFEKEVVKKADNYDKKIYTNYEMQRRLYIPEYFIRGIVVWNKLYKRYLYDDIRFPVGKINEDEFATYKVLYKCRSSICVTEEELYYYRINENSIMGQKFNPKRLDVLDAFEERKEFYKSKGENELYFSTVWKYQDMLKKFYILAKQEKLENKDDFKKIKKALKKNIFSYLHTDKASKKEKIKMFMFSMLPDIYLRMMKINDKIITLKKNFKIKNFIFNFNKYKLYCKKNEQKEFVIFNTPEHGNIGDHAIIDAEEQLLEKLKITPFEVPTRNNEIYFDSLKSVISPNAIIAITGGGFIGSQWLKEEQLVNDVISTYKDHKIIVFPQTFYFKNDDAGKKELIKSVNIFNNATNIYVFAREDKSFEFIKKNYNLENVFLVPDMVLINEFKDFKYERKGILLCLRHDVEGVLSEENKKYVENILKKYDTNINYTDTVINKNITALKRSKFIRNKLREFAKAKIVITDRLHGMIFAAITGTPCIALSNYNQKVKGVYEWIKNLDYIVYEENIKDIEKDVKKLIKCNNLKYDMNYEKFKKIENILKENEENNV